MPQPPAPDAYGTWVTRHARSLTLLAVLLGLVLRLGFSFGYWVGKPLTHDEHEYLTLARNLAAGRGFTYDPVAPGESPTEERFSRPPLYPFFIAVVARDVLLAGDREAVIRRVKIAQAIVGAIGVWLVARLALGGGAAAGVLAALLAAVYPPLVWITGYVLTEALYATLALASVLLLDRAAARAAESPPPDGRLALAGILAGASALTRSVGLLFIVLAVVWLAWRSRRRALAFAVGALLVIAPWSIRTSIVHQRPMLIAAEGGVNFWVGNHPLAQGEGDMAANPRIKAANVEFRRRHAGLSPEALEPLYYRDALARIAERPVWWTGLLARKVFYAWVPVGPSYTLHSRLYYVTSLVSYGLLAPFGIAGAIWLVGRRRAPVALFLLAGSTLLAELIFFPQERYRIPVLDPALIVCATAWIGSYLTAAGRR